MVALKAIAWAKEQVRDRPEDRISDFVAFDPGLAVKFTIYRTQPSGSAGDPDIFGSQQYAPLLDVEVPLP